ncbi:hypothetical protein UFOVP188_39 [uncultured Caudovirales phage]|uniref:DNA transfer protein p32 n=1 Tax=uncultured Caudovirales phage TaxID=2100421 RepID=A0A6J7WFA0_9CAUD|nr:hypothetical protein UFOVP188_39 [uncultured Caudovirales phage]
MTWVAAAVVGSSLIGAYGANKAANTQAAGTQAAIQSQERMFNTQNAQQAPYRQTGYNALNQIGQLGSGTYGIYGPNGEVTGQGAGTGYLTHQFGPEDFQAGIDPSYNWRLQQGNMATANMINRGGGAISGNALTGLNDYAQGAASQEFGNAFNRFQTQRGNIYNTLAGIAGIGQNAQSQTSQLAQNTANNIGQAQIGGANATAGGQVGMANAISGGLQNYGNQQYIASLLKPQMTTPAGYGTSVPTSPTINIG